MDALTLHNWRRKAKMTQQQLADHLGVHAKTVLRWERGKTPIPVDLFQRLPIGDKHLPAEMRIVCAAMRGTRPDLDLYEHVPQRGWVSHPEHPHRLAPGRWPNKVPLEVLDSPEYKDLLARFRAGTYTPSPFKGRNP